MQRLVTAAGVLLAAAAVAACGSPPGAPSSAPDASSAPETTSAPDTTEAAAPATTEPGRSDTADPPRFSAEVATVSAGELGASWRPGCPVPPSELRRVTLDHWGFEGTVVRGELVVHRDVVDEVVMAMARVFEARFPIERMRAVDEYGADDARSMAANNTSAFNCRRVAGTQRWSEHAYGTAIDVNPVQNPYVHADGTVEPPSGAPYADRSREVPGMLRDGGPVVSAFEARGWGWGGRWSAPDYQHLSRSGR